MQKRRADCHRSIAGSGAVDCAALGRRDAYRCWPIAREDVGALLQARPFLAPPPATAAEFAFLPSPASPSLSRRQPAQPSFSNGGDAGSLVESPSPSNEEMRAFSASASPKKPASPRVLPDAPTLMARREPGPVALGGWGGGGSRRAAGAGAGAGAGAASAGALLREEGRRFQEDRWFRGVDEKRERNNIV